MNKYVMLSMLLVLMFTSACGGETAGSGTFVWIDVPVNGLTIPIGQPVHVEGHATSSDGIARVEIWINGALTATISSLHVDGELARFSYDWTPPGAGDYTIQAIGFGGGGQASEPDTTRIIVGEQTGPTPVIGCPTPVGGGPTPVSCPTLVEGTGCPTPVGGGPTPVSCPTLVEGEGCPTPVGGGPTPVSCPTLIVTDTPVPPEGAVIQFWAEPPEIQAGACTTIRWHLENVQGVVFGGIQQQMDGSYQDCLCDPQRYTLTVTHLDGSEEKRTVDISVTGSCVTPTATSPPQDTTPPPAPSPAVPDNGLTLGCKASQNLVWLPVDDPSGIASYQVGVQRHSGDNNWQAVGGSPFTASGKNVSVPVECGWYYRWRVRAVDGKGNIGPWSGWWQFTVTLT
jgi:hypothetical protein